MTQEQFFTRYKYDVDTDLLGGGGFGKVYKAFDETRNRYVAIKVSEVKKGQESLSLMKEVDLAASLPEHKNVAHYESCERFKFHLGIFDYGILQYYPLGNLSQLVKSKKLSEAEKEKIANGIISGIQHLHSNNVVHRDLKSANILIAKGYQGEYVPKIADFGLSKQFTENEKSYFSNSFAGGSLLYVAPEQLEGKELRKNVDLWSLGVVLFQLFVGDTPFRASVDDGSETARAEIISKIKSADIPSAISTIPSKWHEVIRGCLVTDPTQRMKSIEDVISISEVKSKVIGNKTLTKIDRVTIVDDPPLPKPSKQNNSINEDTKLIDKTELKVKIKRKKTIFSENLYGFLDIHTNKIIIPYKFIDVKSVENGLAIVKNKSFKYGIVDKKSGLEITLCIYDILIYYHKFGQSDQSYFEFKLGRKEGFIDEKGNVIVEGIFDDYDDLYEAMEKYLHKNKKGNQ